MKNLLNFGNFIVEKYDIVDFNELFLNEDNGNMFSDYSKGMSKLHKQYNIEDTIRPLFRELYMKYGEKMIKEKTVNKGDKYYTGIIVKSKDSDVIEFCTNKAKKFYNSNEELKSQTKLTTQKLKNGDFLIVFQFENK